MAALDPKYEFHFASGAPTAGNFNAAAGSPMCTVDASHFLHVASGAALPAAPGAPNRFTISWTVMHVAMLKVHSLSNSLHGTPSGTRIVNLRAMHDALQRTATGGLTFAVLGSVDAALAKFVSVARDLAMAAPAAWELGPAHFQSLPLPPAAATFALPPTCEWFMHASYD